MKSASRTLVKSPPELWELLDQPERMQGLMCGLIGRATEVSVEKREPQSFLRWEATGNGADAWIEVELAEKGWGTNVKLKADNGDEPTKLEGWLDAVLEELATPQKRPFETMESPLPEAPESEPEPEQPAEEPPAVVEPVAEAPVTQAPSPSEEPAPKRRRFFGLL